MIKLLLNNVQDLYKFTDTRKYRCFAHLNTGYVITKKCNNRLIKEIIYIIATNDITCTMEIISKQNYFIDEYINGKMRESDSLTHIYTYKDLTEHLDGESNYYNDAIVGDLVMVSATEENDDDEYYF